jgi:hypothetical protein
MLMLRTYLYASNNPIASALVPVEPKTNILQLLSLPYLFFVLQRSGLPHVLSFIIPGFTASVFCAYITFSIIYYCQVPSRPSRSRQRSRMNACPQDDRDRSTHFMPEVPQIHTTLLTDLLSGPLSSLHGPQRLAFDQLFQEIDSTLKENTSAIQLCIENIVRAPYHLAGKCRPLLEDLAHAQMNTGHGSVGVQPLINQGCSQDVNIQAAHGTSSCVHI